MPPYRRSTFLINRKFQFRFALYVCSWLLALSFVYPLIVYNLFDYFVRYASLDPHGPSIQALQDTRHEVLLLLFLLQVIFLFVTFLISIFMSHRIAGPIYKLSKTLRELKNGNIDQELHFRDKDHFRDLAIEYNEMLKGLRHHFGSTDATALKNATTSLERSIETASAEAKPSLEKALAALRKPYSP